MESNSRQYLSDPLYETVLIFTLGQARSVLFPLRLFGIGPADVYHVILRVAQDVTAYLGIAELEHAQWKGPIKVREGAVLAIHNCAFRIGLTRGVHKDKVVVCNRCAEDIAKYGWCVEHSCEAQSSGSSLFRAIWSSLSRNLNGSNTKDLKGLRHHPIVIAQDGLERGVLCESFPIFGDTILVSWVCLQNDCG